MSNISNSQVREDSDKATLKRRLEGNYSHMLLHMAGEGGNRNSLQGMSPIPICAGYI